MFKMDSVHTMHIVDNIKSPKPLWLGLFKWRRRWDSNPRYARTYDGFQGSGTPPKIFNWLLEHHTQNKIDCKGGACFLFVI